MFAIIPGLLQNQASNKLTLAFMFNSHIPPVYTKYRNFKSSTLEL